MNFGNYRDCRYLQSHESWAVIHQGTVPPVQEDEDFCHWQRWHRYLDDEDEMRKIEKVSTFAAMAEEFAYCYVEEVKTRDWIRWEEVCLTPAVI